MKKQTPVSLLVSLSIVLAIFGCGKTVDHSGGRFAVTEPDVTPTPTPSATATPHPSSTPIPTATPFPGEVVCNEKFSNTLAGISLYSMGTVAIGHVHTDSRVAIMGQSQLFQFSSGEKLSPDKNRSDLMLGDPTRLTAVRIPNGRCSTRTETIRLNSEALGGFWKNANVISFETINAAISRASMDWQNAPLNGKVELRCTNGADPTQKIPGEGPEPEERSYSKDCTLYLIGWHNGANTFQIIQKDIASAQKIVIDVPHDSSAIVRVLGQKIKFKKREIRGEPHVQSSKVVWHFPGVSEVSVDKSVAIGQWVMPDGKTSIDGFLLDGGIVSGTGGSIWNTIVSGAAGFSACTPIEP